jgi:FkbM family methyltransferase
VRLSLRGHLGHLARLATDPRFRGHRREIRRLERLPRYRAATTRLLGQPFEIVDAASFLEMYAEIWEREAYRFVPAGGRPFILDGGANVGVGVAFFKRAYPDCEIVAFEPDPGIFAVLERNVRRAGYRDVTLVPRALWTAETSLGFRPEGGNAGRLARPGDPAGSASVPTARLRDYLDRRVDLLKLDIEGAETEVLLDSADRLGNVRNIFVEFHGFASEPQGFPRLVTLLAEAGFRLNLHANNDSPRPLVERKVSAGMDLQFDLFGFRE